MNFFLPSVPFKDGSVAFSALLCLLAVSILFVGCDLFGEEGPTVRFTALSETRTDSLKPDDIKQITFNNGTLPGEEFEKIRGQTFGSKTYAPIFSPDSLRVSFVVETDEGTYAEGRFARRLADRKYIVTFLGNFYDRFGPQRPLSNCFGCLDVYSFPVDTIRSPRKRSREIDSVFVMIAVEAEDGAVY